MYEQDIENCLQVLNRGGTILYPTDTIWGIGCDATNNNSVEKIVAIKNRPPEKSFVVLVGDERDVLKYAASLDLAVFDYLAKTVKPTTVIYENAVGLAPLVLAEDGSVALRVCRDEFCRHLLKRFRKPIVSTSANMSGKPSPSSFREIDDEIKKRVDYIVKYRQEEVLPSVPSSIIKWRKGKITIIRP